MGATGATGATGSPGESLAATQVLFGALTHDVTSPGGNIEALYQTILGRAADPLGLEDYVADLNNGTPADTIAQYMLNSDEYATNLAPGAQSNDDFLNELYQNGLNRAPDDSGRAFYDNLLANGVSRADVATDIALSPESQGDQAATFQAGLFVPSAADAQVARLYYGILGRAPDAPGLSDWEQQYAQGQSLTGIAQSFLSSQEYQINFGSRTDSQFVTALYEGALGRAPDASGMQTYLNLLSQGTSRASVAVDIAESTEAKTFHTPDIEVGLKLA